ncbi:hypothetical protein [Clostridium ihumii]|uniref:hypothetical protein n=1 Tax=Clostridium ihumii TaxID=1470356 RepID=UPI00054F04AD|nr:hypothetical protein [Clostridium ihumii]
MLKKYSNVMHSVINHKETCEGEAFPLSLKILIPYKYQKNMLLSEAEVLKELNERIDLELQKS